MSTDPVNVSPVFSNGDASTGFAKHHVMPTAVMNEFVWSTSLNYSDSLLNKVNNNLSPLTALCYKMESV